MAFGPDGNLYITQWYGEAVAGKVYGYDAEEDSFYFLRNIPLPGHIDPGAFRGTGIAFVGDYFYIGSVDGVVGNAAWIDEYNLSDSSLTGHYCEFDGHVGAIKKASDTSLWVGWTGGAVVEIEIDTCEIVFELDFCDIGGMGNADIALREIGDCDGNGKSDACEIALGVLEDKNRNWVPDDYEVCGLPGDVNGDGTIDVLDLIEVLANWGACP